MLRIRICFFTGLLKLLHIILQYYYRYQLVHFKGTTVLHFSIYHIKSILFLLMTPRFTFVYVSMRNPKPQTCVMFSVIANLKNSA